jgi:hypothetical protein
MHPYAVKDPVGEPPQSQFPTVSGSVAVIDESSPQAVGGQQLNVTPTLFSNFCVPTLDSVFSAAWHIQFEPRQ